MIDYISILFGGKTEEERLNEEYENYKEKYKDILVLYKQGNMYSIVDTTTRFYKMSTKDNHKYIGNFNYSEDEYKKQYIDKCREYQKASLPILKV